MQRWTACRPWRAIKKIIMSLSAKWALATHGSGAPTHEEQQQQNWDWDSHEPKQNPPHLSFFFVSHSNLPF
jgi:hypothetical protein